jgi:anhydro-N-acetylmuramic acid kinase
MTYRVIGVMSGSSMDGLDIVYCVLDEIGGKWQYEIVHADCVAFDTDWIKKLAEVNTFNIEQYLQVDADFGKYIGEKINAFITQYQLEHKVHFIASHGHTTLHRPQLGFSAQIGCGASIAAVTALPVINNLRMMDVAHGGNGAPIVPIADQLLFSNYDLLLNIGGIANITMQQSAESVAFDICAANRILNVLAQEINLSYDKDGAIAQQGNMIASLFEKLNALDYYKQPHPKSLANEFGLETVLPIINATNGSVEDKLHTYTHHIALQIAKCCKQLTVSLTVKPKLLITGGGALNKYLVNCIGQYTNNEIEIEVPSEITIQYKEALAMALIGALRWREEINVLHTVTGAKQNTINGALWMVTQ